MKTPLKIKLGTRGSPLALWQAHWVRDLLIQQDKNLEVEIIKIKTTGDKITDVALAKIGGKGLFLKEIEEAMLAGEIDLAVHSMKDVPMQLPEGLCLGAILQREDCRDAFVTLNGSLFESFKSGAIVGSSSLRRVCQLKAIKPDLHFKDLRGNVGTRLQALEDRKYDGIVLAAAGLKRLGLENRITEYLPIIPAGGQGAVGIEIRSHDSIIKTLIQNLHHELTATCVEAERAFLRVLEAGCQSPIGCLATYEDDKTIKIESYLSDLEGQQVIRKTWIGPHNECISASENLAREVLDLGGRVILKKIYTQV